MVVNVNPTETGFDENSQVMKFAAVAKDVATWRRIHPTIDLNGISAAGKLDASSFSHVIHFYTYHSQASSYKGKTR